VDPFFAVGHSSGMDAPRVPDSPLPSLLQLKRWLKIRSSATLRPNLLKTRRLPGSGRLLTEPELRLFENEWRRARGIEEVGSDGDSAYSGDGQARSPLLASPTPSPARFSMDNHLSHSWNPPQGAHPRLGRPAPANRAGIG
jgi:hypothetical protein